jgi:hypothetical protein
MCFSLCLSTDLIVACPPSISARRLSSLEIRVDPIREVAAKRSYWRNGHSSNEDKAESKAYEGPGDPNSPSLFHLGQREHYR